MTDPRVMMTLSDFDKFRSQEFDSGYETGARDHATAGIILPATECSYCDGAYTSAPGVFTVVMADVISHMVRDHWEEIANVRAMYVTAETPPEPTPPPDAPADQPHECTERCEEDPGSCDVYKTSVGYPGFTK